MSNRKTREAENKEQTARKELEKFQNKEQTARKETRECRKRLESLTARSKPFERN